MFVTGRNDGILPPNFTSRAYFGLNNVVDGSTSSLRYYEVTNAQHLDSFNQFPGYNDKYIPLHRYFNQAMDLMYAHLRDGAPLPPSQVVHTMPRGPGAPPITAANVPPIAASPPRERADHLQRRAGSDTRTDRQSAGYIPQFHIGPIGVLLQHGPKPPAFQRPR